MNKKFLFDLTLLQPHCPNRGIPKVIVDILNVVIGDQDLKRRVEFVVEKRHEEYIKERFPEIGNKLYLIRNDPINKFMFTGILCDFRMKFSPKKYAYIFIPYFNSICYRSNIPQYALIYDIIWVRFWKETLLSNFTFKNILVVSYILYKHFKIRFADKLICISEFTKTDLSKLIPSVKQKSHVIPLHVKGFKPVMESEVKKEILSLKSEKYLLYVGGLDIRKNIKEMINYVGVYCKTKRIKLVIAGAINDFEIERLNPILKQHHLEETVNFFPFVSEPELSFLFDNAEVFVFYSSYEGFGLPLIEAMSKKIPVIAFDNSAISEVVKDAGVLVEDGNNEQFIEKLDHLRNSPDLISRLIIKGKKVAEHYNEKNFTVAIKQLFNGFDNGI